MINGGVYMGKAAMCIRMLQILNTGRIYKISELAELLETNPRNVIEYKRELNEVATESGYEFYIEKIPGRYGGYQLNGHTVIPSLSLTQDEKRSIVDGFIYLMARNDFMSKKEYQLALGKIISSLVFKDIQKEESLLVINRYPLSMSEADISYRHKLIKDAIKLKRKVKFTYLSQKNTSKEHVLDPYEIFMYNNAYFVIGWLNSKNHADICWFKLNRIETIQMTNDKYRVSPYFNKSDYIDEYGFKSDGEWCHVEFVAHGTYASLCKERIYGKNQVVESIDENSTKVSVDMQNKENIRVFVLGFGKNIDVLEPQWLKDDLLEIADELKQKYGA